MVGLKLGWVRKNCYVEELHFLLTLFLPPPHIFLAYTTIAIKIHSTETMLYIQVTYSPMFYKDAKNALWSSKEIASRCLVAILNYLSV